MFIQAVVAFYRVPKNKGCSNAELFTKQLLHPLFRNSNMETTTILYLGLLVITQSWPAKRMVETLFLTL